MHPLTSHFVFGTIIALKNSKPIILRVMKKTIVLSLMAIFTLAACQEKMALSTTKVEYFDNNEPGQPELENTTESNESKYISLSEQEMQLVSSNNDFAFNLFRKVDTDESHILSPLSITYALGMLNNGATGKTQQEINTTLGFGDAGADAINAFCKKLLEESPSLDKGTKVLIGNTIYTNKGYTLKPKFVKTAKEFYDATPECRDFYDGKTLGVINQWASDHTNQMIQKVLDEKTFNPDAVSYLLNAIYFKGTWMDKFNKDRTKEALFNGKDKVMMMQQEHKFQYADNDLYQSVRLPYGNGAYCMTVLLPHEDKSIEDVLNSLNSESWANNGYQMEEYIVDLKLPRFETTTDMELNKIMKELGVARAFTREAEFDEFCNTHTQIGLMKQVAKVKLDEEGTEAAAVTVIETMKSSAVPRKPERVEFHANRTFLYVITEESTGAIFFIGEFTGE